MPPYLSNLLILTSINSIAALGLYVTLLSGQLSSAHAALFGIAGYTSGMLGIYLGWPIPLTVICAVALSGAVGAGLAVLNQNQRGFYLAIVTLAFGETLVVVLQNALVLGGADGLSGIPTATNLPVALLCALLVSLAVRRWEEHRGGQMARAVGEDDVAAESVGIDVRRTKMVAFGLGGLLSGLAGVLYAHYIGLVTPSDMSFARMIVITFYLGIGGMHTYAGAIVGAVVVTFLPELLRFSVYERYMYFGLAVVLMMILRPLGIMVRRPIGTPGVRRQLSDAIRKYGRARRSTSN